MASSSIASASNYPYPSTLIPTCFVSIRLCDVSNYLQWEMQMLCLIESQELVGFIDGTILPPPEAILRNGGSTFEEAVVVNEEYRMWKRSDRLVKGWILGSLGEQVLATMAADQLSTARDVWTSLRSTLGPHEEKEEKDKDEDDEHKAIAMQHDKHLIHYPYPSGINVANFVSIKLTKTNYSAWLRQIFSLLECQELKSFVTDPSPPKYYVGCTNEDEQQISEEYKRWKRTDLLVQGWILGSISSEEVILSVARMLTSRDIMGKLEETFVPDIESHFIYKKPVPPSLVYEVATNDNDRSRYLPLYKAVLVGNWEIAKAFMDRDRDATTAMITESGHTVLHLTVGNGKYNHFLKKLVAYLPTEALTALTTTHGDTALHVAAKVGNTKAAKKLMKKYPSFLRIRNDKHMLPLYLAAQNGHRDTLLYFQSISSEEDYAGQAGADHLSWIITQRYFDIALDLIEEYPHMARLETSEICVPPLIAIAEQGHGFFRSGNHLNYLKDLIYIRIPLKHEKYYDVRRGGDVEVENQACCYSQVLKHWRVQFVRVWEGLQFMLWDVIQLLVVVPNVKKLHRKKIAHHQAVQLVKRLCEGIRSTNDESSYVRRTSKPITIAASLGTFEIVEGIVDILPQAIWACDDKGHNIPQLAVINRSERVFNLLYQMSGFRQYITTKTDDFGNNMLHFAGNLAPPHKLKLVSGAALQMQRELQWFQEVAKLMNPICKNTRNSAKETPAMVFTREHKELVIAGEKWMKDTANSCTIAASLIITIVFAAAITVPGGNNDSSGLPIFYKGRAFWIFAISDAISLFTSTTSLLMFLSILTARYAEEDFLVALPVRLVYGLVTLFISISSMIIAFSASVYLVFGEGKRLIIIPLAALSCLPITSFATLQFPLLRDVLKKTWGHGLFWKQSDHPFY